LISAIKEMNRGRDFRGSTLGQPTDFCAGAAIEFGRPLETEAALTYGKAEAGAEFFVGQAAYDGATLREFSDRYAEFAGAPLFAPMLFGVQVPAKDGVVLGSMPEGIWADLERGRSGVEIAVETASRLWDAGARAFYVIAPILKGGARDYEAAARAIAEIKRLC
jgi:hypothetical protein